MAAAARLPTAPQNQWPPCSARSRFQGQATAGQARPVGPCGSGARSCTRSGLRHSGQRLTPSVRRRLVVSGSSGPGGGPRGGPGSSGADDTSGLLVGPSRASLKLQLELLGALLVRYPGVTGSLAVAGGYFLHINALPLHWDAHDAALGLRCAAPILAMDALLMLPDWSPGTASKTIKIKAPRSVAEKLRQQGEVGSAADGQGRAPAPGVVDAVEDLMASAAQPPAGDAGSGGGEELVEVERTISVRADQHPALAALYRLQLDKASNNVGRLLWAPLELLLLLTLHLAEEMLYRAVILTWAAGWTIDRLYEAGADETVSLLGMQLATPQAGAVLAAVGCATASLALLVQQAFFPLRLISQAAAELDAKEAADGAGPQTRQERARMRKVLDKVRRGMERQRRWSTAVEGARDVTEWACYSTSFLLTGNLLAPYVTAVTSDLLFTCYQRLKARQVERSQAQALATIRDLQRTALVLKDAKAALQPPAPRSGKGDGEAGQEEQGSGEVGSADSDGGSADSGGSGSPAPHGSPDQQPGSDDAQARK